MKTLLIILSQVLVLTAMSFAQENKILIADGTREVPEKNAMQPAGYKLSAEEIEAVKDVAMEKEVEFKVSPQMSSEESLFKANFALLDVAEGFFISREIKSRVYLYSAYSEKMKRNYQGIIALRNTKNPKKYTVLAHYVYGYRGDKNIRQLPDINGNVLDEIAIFSNPPSKKGERRYVRIIEFSPDGLIKLGSKEIYSSIPQKQRTPNTSGKREPTTHIYTPPKVSAIKLYAVKKLGKPTTFSEERWSKLPVWVKVDKYPSRPTEFLEDTIDYVELTKPLFPKGIRDKNN
jgi:hypothetical protein